jgi:ubiquinone/menaquinone biosynthesis C-methylase UbiE
VPLSLLLRMVLITVIAIVFFWVVILRLLSWLGAKLGHSPPCPASFSWLVDNPLRRRYLRHVAEWVGVRPGERVLELGPGPGTFTIEAARRASPRGSVVAVDIQPEMVFALERRVRKAGLHNVQAHVAAAGQLPLDDSSVDRAFMVTVLPEILDKQLALSELRRVLKPNGTLSITEEFLDPDYPLAQTTVRWACEAGFQLVERYGNWWAYTLNFRRST